MNQNQAITPFAMRCTQEQFDDVKEELIQMGYDVSTACAFGTYNYLKIRSKTMVSSCHYSNIEVLNIPFSDHWDKSLFLKMAGKPDAESRELLGYKRNPELDITAEELAVLLRCGYDEKDGLFIWINSKYNQDHIFERAQSLGIVGEGKWLVPVYRETEHYEIIDLKPLPQSEIDRIKETAFIRGTPEWQKAVKEIDVNKEPISEQLLRTLSDTEVHYMAQNGRLNISDYMRYLDLKRCNKVWSNKTDTTNMKPTQYSASYSSRITGTYEQQKGGEG